MKLHKFCSAPNCRISSRDIDRRNFYKFPLQDQARLQQWLKYMGCEGWTPSRHQYICHNHFIPSCFKVHWGVRSLESNAVPTIFNKLQKRKASDEDTKDPKRLHLSPGVSVCDGAESQSLDPPVWLTPVIQSADGHRRGGSETEFCTRDDSVLPIIETISSVLPWEETLLFPYSPDVVLCSALSPEPISSTLPIVSKHQRTKEEKESLEPPDLKPLLEEHCYHKPSLDRGESRVLRLQRTVRLIKRRHRRHVAKMLRMETTLNQLRSRQLLNQERLQLLERAYIQSSVGAPDDSETVAIHDIRVNLEARAPNVARHVFLCGPPALP